MLGVTAAAAMLALAGATSAADDGFAALWKVFATAMAKKDKATLASMTSPALGSFAELSAQWLTPAVRRCIATGKPVPDVDLQGVHSYYVKCAHMDYVFYKQAGVWKLGDVALGD
jgi:hypothetical protein